jgi:hypothetical protein
MEKNAFKLSKPLGERQGPYKLVEPNASAK